MLLMEMVPRMGLVLQKADKNLLCLAFVIVTFHFLCAFFAELKAFFVMRSEYIFSYAVQYWYERFYNSAGTYFLLSSHRYLTLIELTKYKCAFFVFWKIVLVAFSLCFGV